MEQQQIITTTKGGPFGNKGSLAIALKNAGLQDSHKAAEYEGGGWVGVPNDKFAGSILSAEVQVPEIQEPEVQEISAPSAPPKTVKVRVHRSNVDPDNKNLQISICVNSAKNRKIFYPGEEIELTLSEIESLKNSTEDTQIIIPPDSGIYQAANPEAIAKNQYPGMRPTRDGRTNLIIMMKRVPNYIIETVE